jgi:hypothetical protein
VTEADTAQHTHDTKFENGFVEEEQEEKEKGRSKAEVGEREKKKEED